MSRTAHKLMASSGGKAYEIEQSLMIEADGGALSLKRTPSSGGNRRTFTWSGWVKKTKNGAYQSIFASITNSSNTIDSLMFYNDDKFTFQGFNGANFNLMTTRVFRDISAWYHIVLAVDSTQGTASNRIKIYINGVQETSFGTETYCSQNFDFGVNHTVPQSIANNDYNRVSGYLADINFIDGTQLTPSSFGETDSETGQWIPKKYGGGSYGTNGFYLPFAKNDRYSTYFDGSTSSAIQIADHADFAVGSGSFTYECWFYEDGDPGSYRELFGQADSNGSQASIGISLQINSAHKPVSMLFYNDGAANAHIVMTSSTAYTLDKWNHLAFVRNGTSLVLYLNGTSVATATSSESANNGVDCKFAIGRLGEDPDNAFKGWISDFRFVKGTAVYTGNFTPPTAPLTAVTNTKLLCCQGATATTENSGTSKTLILNAANTYTQQLSPFDYDWYDDHSGQDNHWQAENINVNDIMLDSPTNNYPTINSATPYNSTITNLSQGNLHVKAVTYNNGYYGNHIATVKVPESGKWYIETRMAVESGTGNTAWIGVMPQTLAIIPKDGSGSTDGNYAANSSFTGMVTDLIATVDTIRLFDGGSAQATVSSATATSYVIALALDVDNNKVYGGYDSGSGITWLDSGNPAAGSNGQAHTFTSETIIQLEVGPNSGSNSNSKQTLNFGQNGTFCGQEIAGGNTDGNGEGNFFYAPPSGFKALCSKNLPTPTIKKSTEHFNTVLYTGSDNDAVSQNVTGVGHQPDLVWIKRRNLETHHVLTDAVRGVTKTLNSNQTVAEVDDTYGVTAFGSDGFTVREQDAAGGQTNTGTLVSWNWKAGGSGSANNSGDINATVSANATAGFSIVSFTGDGSNGNTVAHGLGKEPQAIFYKRRDGSSHWYMVTKEIDGSQDYLALSSSTFAAASEVYGNPTSSTISNWTWQANAIIAYVWAEIEGFSKIGSFKGNGSANGPYVYTGFRPAWIMIKRTDAGSMSWGIFDSKRSPSNEVDELLYANSSDAEDDSDALDIISNGFKIRTTDNFLNNSSGTMFYMAFAESPFKYANAR